MSRFLGVDLGTTFLKGGVLNLTASTVSHVRRVAVPDPVAGLPPSRYEVDPQAILAAVRALLGELLAAAPDATGLVLCSQMHCLVLLDEAGNPRSNIITWKDQRATEPGPQGHGSLLDELTARLTASEQRQLGGEVRVGTPVSTLFALQQHGLLEQGWYAASLPDYVLTALCSVEPSTDPTLASAHGLFNIESGDWHWPAIAKLELDSLRWPKIRRIGDEVGIATIGGKRLRCFAPVGDQQCALLGAGLQEGELSLNISTGSQVSLVGRECSLGTYQVRPYFDGKQLRTIVSVPAGRSLALLVELLAEVGRRGGHALENAWEIIAKAVEQVQSTDLQVDLSFFASLTGERGGITNISEGNLTVGHLFLAAFRAMAENYRKCAEILSPKREWNRVVFSGGLAQQSERLRVEILGALGNPRYRLCATQEDTLEGLLKLAQQCARNL